MKLSKKQEAKLLKTYKSYWDGYQTGDVKNMAKLLDSNYTQIGSAEAEVFSNKKDAVTFLHDTIDQVAGKAEIRNQSIKLEYLGDHVLVNDLFDLYVLTDGQWVYYAKLRASTLMYEDQGKWKFIHQHSSVPDIRTEDGENLATEKITAENLQLKDAVKRRTMELEQKNRELEIEAALERVRARTMAMHRSDELREVVNVFFEQLHPFGLAKWGFQIRIAKEDKSGFYAWLSTPAQRVLPERYEIPTLNHWALKKYWAIYEQQLEYETIEVKGKDKLKLDQLLFKKSDLKKLPKAVKANILASDYVVFSCASMRFGLLEAIDVEVVPAEKVAILKSFAKVFEQTYTRFLDLQKAEEQAREAKIEVALERIRAASMSMHKSEDLPQVALALLNQIDLLEIPHISCSINIVNNKTKDFVSYSAHSIETNDQMVTDQLPELNLNDIGFMREALKKVDDWDPYYTMELRGKYLNEVMELWKASNFSGINNQYVRDNPDVIYLSWAAFNGMSSISLSSIDPLTDEQLSILERMAKTFAMSYTRFLDLQKVEEQAREAMIEVALERIRAQVTGMQQSSDLFDIVVSMRKEFLTLGHEADYFWHMRWLPDAYEMSMTSEDGSRVGMVISVPKFVHEAITVLAEWEKGDGPICVLPLNADDAWDYIENMNEHGRYEQADPNAPTQDDIRHIGGLTFIIARTSHGEIGYSLPGEVPAPPEDALDTLIRFAAVFDLAYTRFEDLKQAEAQARETEIELALERVRARTMAMQNSDELQEVINSVYDRLVELDIEIHACTIITRPNNPQELQLWFASTAQQYFRPFHMPNNDNIIIKDVWNGLNNTREIFSKTYPFKEKNEFFKHIFKHTDFKNISESRKQLVLEAKGYTVSNTFMKHSGIQLQRYSDKIFSNQENEILKRFGKVFEQTYIRFLDLQKAEAQAREAQIEASLERVRSSTMAMHKSEDLLISANLLYTEFKSLGITQYFTCGFVIVDEEKSLQNVWITDMDGEIFESFNLPLIGDPVFQQRYEKWQQKVPVFLQKVGGAKLKKHLAFAIPHFGSEEAEDMVVNQFPDPTYFYMANFSHGYLHIVGDAKLTDHEEQLLARFTGVFQQTYTRFLDLQKAEEQAREAKIETELEKIRAKSMAMHKSEELRHVVNQSFIGLTGLGIKVDTAFIITERDKDIKKGYRAWAASNKGFYQEELHVPYRGLKADVLMHKAWQDKKDSHTVFSKKSKDQIIRKSFELSSRVSASIPEARKKKIFEAPGLTYYDAYRKNLSLAISKYDSEKYPNEDIDVISRFADVLDQSYTRFLDLQKAEAQAREAQIEASLERIRARTMGMHKSDELKKVIEELFNELKLFVLKIDVCAIDIFDGWSKDLVIWTATPEQIYPTELRIPALKNPMVDEIYNARINKQELLSDVLTKKQKDAFYRHAIKNSPLGKLISSPRLKKVMSAGSLTRSMAIFKNTGLMLANFQNESYTDSENDLIIRFGKVFEQTYSRFLDLQKAEEQAREAQIETSLERVRAASMAMHHSADLQSVISVVLEQFEKLEISVHSTYILEQLEDTKATHFWAAATGQTYLEQTHVPRIKHPFFDEQYKAIKNGTSFYTLILTKAEKDKMFRHYFKNSSHQNVPLERQDFVFSTPGLVSSNVLFDKTGLTVQRYTKDAFSDEENEVIQRIGFVFEQAYTRFLDLQKAEEQAREAQIEASLERVRAASMAMHKSSELRDVVNTLYGEFLSLNLNFQVAGIQLILDNSKDFHIWMSTDDGVYGDVIHWPYIDLPIFHEWYKAWSTGTMMNITLSKTETRRFFSEYFKLDAAPKERKIAVKSVEIIDFLGAYQKHTGLVLMRYSEGSYSETEKDILTRFSIVFEQTYTRFLDLQKAEAQVREAQIEAALERVRAKSMAMHKTSELKMVIDVISEQFAILDIAQDACMINIFGDETSKDWNFWIATYPDLIHVPFFKNPILSKLASARKRHEVFYSLDINQAEKNEFFEHFYKVAEGVKVVRKRRNFIFKTPGWTSSVALSKFASIHLINYQRKVYTEEENKVLQRIGKVFEQTYTRFLDLQKAEGQAREAQVEASLERVRAKAMAMHSSEDLVDTASQLFKEFQQLNISFIRCGVLKLNEDRTGEVYSYSHTKENEAVAVFGNLNLTGHELMDGVFKHWQLQKEYVHELKGDAVKRYYQLVNKQLKIPKVQLEKSHFGYAFYFPEGSLYCFTSEKLTEETLQILRRFNQVLGLTYRRYFELKEAEARELKAIKEASLDRVRAEIASMRTATDLGRITPLIWQELTQLGVPFFRCGIFIINEDEQIVHAYLSTPEGEAVAALHIPFNDKDNPLIKPAVKNWRLQKSYKADWNREQFIQQAKALMDKGQIEDPKSYQIMDSPPERLVLHLVPFKQGMLYVGSTAPLSTEHIDLMKDLAKAFSVAYARYEDFVELENAKTKVEGTLNELKSTQTQLIQSEKMASLGELTAGIAHEIQNPLNFVNNFSDVSGELLEELKEELEKGDMEEVKAISDDIIQNLEKINHHGQRASGIVKGMLAHSRTGTGEKELVDINNLADEYLRLAYHGLRAKDKSFNADFKLDLDDALPQINVVAQDIGRVLLNLINNAFQACTERSRSAVEKDYKPTVTVSSKKKGDKVEISVKDNGMGIPNNIKGKIFEPFFTTKPTGEGTGLGLSMSYDIITKGHGGELLVESKVGKGSEFIIKLPL